MTGDRIADAAEMVKYPEFRGAVFAPEIPDGRSAH
jgi:hypothetical protein